MRNESDTTARPRTDNNLSRLARWLDRRPVESWAFFAAGFVLARFIF
jgi:hypothetical protein